MRPIRLRLTNFLSYRDADISLESIDAAALTGENGSGKSSLLDAITFALFGEGTRGGARQLDAYVTSGADECRVELTFLLSGQTYRVVRHRSIARNKSLLELFVQEGDWRPLSGKTISETEQRIAEILRMDYRTFTASAFVLQGKADSLTADMTDQERKEVLASILGLDLWDRMLERVREENRRLKAEMQALAAQAQRLEGDANQAAVIEEQLTAQRESLQTMQTTVATLEEEVAELEAAARNQPVLQRQIADLRQQISAREQDKQALERERAQAQAALTAAQRTLADAELICRAVAREAELVPLVQQQDRQAADYRELCRQIEITAQRVSQWDRQHESEVVRLTATIKANQAQAATLGRVPCTGTTQAACPLLASARNAAEALAKLQGELEAIQQLSNPHRVQHDHLLQARQALAYDPQRHDTLRRELDAARAVARRQAELDAASTRAREAEQRLAEIDDRMVSIFEEIDRLIAQRKELELQLTEIGVNVAALKQKRDELAGWRQMASDTQAAIGRLEARLEVAHKAAEELVTIRNKAAQLAEQQLTLDVLEQACSKRGGVPALIVENAVPEIERLANDVLNRVSGGRLSVRLDTQIEGKSTGTMQEVLRITVLDGGVERPYRNYSGAERFVVDISLRVALSKFLSHRAGAEIQTLVIDEGFGSLDAVGRQRIVEALDIIRRDFALTLIITHLDELKDVMPHRITVVKGANGSEVTVA